MKKFKRVVLDPDPRLRAHNEDVTDTWPDLEARVRQMYKIMHQNGGVGLAAPQVGWNVRLFVMDGDPEHKPQSRKVFWNPRIEMFGKRTLKHEGCLSVPNTFGSIYRYEQVRLIAMGPDGPVDTIFSGFDAQIIQHEVQHLSGELCVDKFEKETA